MYNVAPITTLEVFFINRHIFSGTIIMFIISWYVMFGMLDHDYDIKQAFVQNTVYSYTQIAVKKGVLYSSVFDEMDAILSSFGDYEIYFKAEKFQGGSSDPITLTGFDVVDTDLRAAGYDLLTIHVLYLKPHPVSVMFKVPPFSIDRDGSNDRFLFGRSCLYIQ